MRARCFLSLAPGCKAATLARCLTTTRLDTRRTDKMCVYQLHPTPAVPCGFGNDCCCMYVGGEEDAHIFCLSLSRSPLSVVCCSIERLASDAVLYVHSETQRLWKLGQTLAVMCTVRGYCCTLVVTFVRCRKTHVFSVCEILARVVCCSNKQQLQQ